MEKLRDFLVEWFGAFAGRDVGDPYQRFISDPNEFMRFFDACRAGGRPCYMSVQPRRKHDVLYGLEKLYYDFDDKWAKPPRLEEVWKETQLLARHVKDEVGAEPFITFSGCKGYNVYVWTWTTFEVRLDHDWPAIAKNFYKGLQHSLLAGLPNLRFLDPEPLGDVKRLSRVPYSRHEESEKLCEPLTLEGVPMSEPPPSLDVYREAALSREFCIRVFNKVRDCVTAQRALRVFDSLKAPRATGCNKVRPCIEEALRTGDLHGENGHLMRLAIAVEYLQQGYEVEQVVDLFSGREKFDECKTRYQVQHAKQRGYKPRRCGTIQGYGFCLGDSCPIFKRRKGDEG